MQAKQMQVQLWQSLSSGN